MLTGLALSHQIVQSAKALQWIMDSLKSQGFAAQETQPSRQKLTLFVWFYLTVKTHIHLLHISPSVVSSHFPPDSVNDDRQAQLHQSFG